MSVHKATQNAEGAHLLDGDLSFLLRDAGSYVEATRIADDPIAAAMIALGKMQEDRR